MQREYWRDKDRWRHDCPTCAALSAGGTALPVAVPVPVAALPVAFADFDGENADDCVPNHVKLHCLTLHCF